PAIDGTGTAYVATSDGWVFAVARSPLAGSSRIRWQVQMDPVGVPLTSPILDEHGRVYVATETGRVHVIDEVPAFQVAFDSDPATPTNRDVYSLREAYGTGDPARTLRLTDVSPRDDQHAYSLDRRMMAFVSDRKGS